MLEYKTIVDFEFVKVGHFYINENPIEVTYENKPIALSVSLQLLHDDFRKADESAYLIYVEDKLVYVGEYSYNLSHRWLRNGESDFVWHHKDDEIKAALSYGSEVSIWLSLSPFLKTPNGAEMNVSKSIEQEVLKQLQLEWNQKGNLKQNEVWRTKNCMRVSTVIRRIERQS